jgi:hypothetical protein
MCTCVRASPQVSEHLSIRDPLRALRLFVWLRRKTVESVAARPPRVPGGPEQPAVECHPFLPAFVGRSPAHQLGASLVVAVALAYWCRLPSAAHRGRTGGVDARCEFAVYMQTRLVDRLVKLGLLAPGATFNGVVLGAFRHLWLYTDAVPPGIVGTSGLQEAFFAIVVAVHTKTAVLLTGPPGCGKTLSFMLAAKCMVGRSGDTHKVFQELLHIVSETFQCNETTNATEVGRAYDMTERTQKSLEDSSPGVFAVVLTLDEAGLPKSRRQALKRLHDPLEQGRVGSVFMSNVTLDAAKTSRMLQVLMSQATEGDLVNLARGLIFGGREEAMPPERDPRSVRVRGLATAFARWPEAFRDLPPSVPREWWFDSRDFLYLCKQLNLATRRREGAAPGDFDASALVAALRRNFQTLERGSFGALVQHFLDHTGLLYAALEEAEHGVGVGADWQDPKPLDTLRLALEDVVEAPSAGGGGEGGGGKPGGGGGGSGGRGDGKGSGPGAAQSAEDVAAATSTHFRHVLIVDKSRTSELSLDVLKLLVGSGKDRGQASARKFKVIALADFPDDSLPTNQAEVLAEVRDAVEEGQTIVLLNTGPLHSALYSLLNRHYTTNKNPHTMLEEPVVFLAIGSLKRSVRIHPNAKIIVLLSASALEGTQLPFLSRFERFVVGADDALESFSASLLARPPPWLAAWDRKTTQVRHRARELACLLHRWSFMRKLQPIFTCFTLIYFRLHPPSPPPLPLRRSSCGAWRAALRSLWGASEPRTFMVFFRPTPPQRSCSARFAAPSAASCCGRRTLSAIPSRRRKPRDGRAILGRPAPASAPAPVLVAAAAAACPPARPS